MNKVIGWRLGLRMLRRDLAAGEVRILLAALVLAVCAVSSIGFLTDRAGRALDIEANRLLGGDAVLRADNAIDDAPRALALRLGLASTETRSFPSMLRVGDSLRLSDLRAMAEGFPLRGGFRLVDSPEGEAYDAQGIPAPGTLWLSRTGAQTLGANVGDVVQVGELPLRLAALVVQEPDAALDYFNVAPKAFFHLDDLQATGLVQFGSRIRHRFIVAGDPAAVESWTSAQRQTLARGQHIETIAEARPEVRSSLERADRFLGLAALVSVVLAGIAVAMAARRHAEHHLDGCAVMRCLGADRRTVLTIHGSELLALGLLGSVLGVVLAWLLQWVIGGWLQQRLGISVPSAGWTPALQGVGVGLCVLLAFALPPVLALRKVPAMRVLRRDIGAFEPGAIISTLAGLSGLGGLLWWKSGSVTLGAIVLGGLLLTLLVLALLGYGLIRVLRLVRGRLRGPWRYGLANVGRRASTSIIQISALGVGLMAVLLLTLVRTDLIERWQAALPKDAPNRFLVNIQPDQLATVRERLEAGGVVNPELPVMVRARLVTVNGTPMRGEDYAARGDRAQRMAEREFNLSTADSLREGDNTIVAGTFWSPQSATDEVELSVEERFAETLGWSVGDRVGFDLAGTPLEGRITSLRRVDWESFRPNFFVLVSPGGLKGMSASHIGAIRVPDSNPRLTDALVREFPTLSVVDIDAVLAQVRNTADQVAVAVEYVFYFTLAAGVLVLLASMAATQDERLREGGVMRVFGASSRQLRWAQLSEFVVIGAISGLTAALAATLIAGVIAWEVFDLPWRPDWRLAVSGGVAGILAVSLTGLLATRRIVSAPPAQTLRSL